RAVIDPVAGHRELPPVPPDARDTLAIELTNLDLGGAPRRVHRAALAIGQEPRRKERGQDPEARRRGHVSNDTGGAPCDYVQRSNRESRVCLRSKLRWATSPIVLVRLWHAVYH